MRARWRERVGNTELGYLLVSDDSKIDGSVLVLGPRAATEPLRSMDCEGLASAIERAAGMPSLEASRHIATEVVRLAGRGLLVSGLLTRHMLEHRILEDPTFGLFAAEALRHVRWDGDWRSLPAGLGYQIETLEPRGYLLRFGGSPVAVVHPKADPGDFMRLDDAGRPPEGVLAADCRSRGARYGLLACRNRYRLFDCDPGASTAEWLDLDAQLLGDERRSCLALLAPRFLAEDGQALLVVASELSVDVGEVKQALDDGSIDGATAAVRISEVVDFHGLMPVELPTAAAPIAEADIGVVCWTGVLPPSR